MSPTHSPINRVLWRARSVQRGQCQAFLRHCTQNLLHDAWDLLPPQADSNILQLGGEILTPAQIWPQARVWQVPLDEEQPPFADSIFNAVVWHLTLSRVNTVLPTLHAWRKTLKKDGVFMATAWGANTLHELRHCLRSAETTLTGGLTPRFMPVFDVKDAGRLLQTVGFYNVTAAAHSVEVLYKHPQQLINDLRAASETCTLWAGGTPLTRAIWQHALQLYATQYRRDNGLYPVTLDTVVMVGFNR